MTTSTGPPVISKMLDIVAPDQDELSPAVEARVVDDLETALGLRPKEQRRRRRPAHVGTYEYGDAGAEHRQHGQHKGPEDIVFHVCLAVGLDRRVEISALVNASILSS